MSERGAILQYAERPSHPRPSLLAACLARLPAPRRAVLDAAPQERRVDSLLGVALALASVRERGLEREPGSLEFPDGGRPGWRDGPVFSIAHAAGLVGCALRADGGAIGLDVESARAVAPSDLRLVTDEAERSLLEMRALTPAALWTRKEAALKWAGLGLRHAAKPRVAVDGVTLAGVALHAATLDLPGGCVASLVTDAPLEPLAVTARDALALLEAMATMPR